MKRRRFHSLFSIMFATLGLLGALLPRGARAVEIIVPTGSATIQAAITAASAGDSVVVEPGTYSEAITLKDGVEVRGVETARTFLSGGGGGPIVTINSAVSATIRNFTFIKALVGIQVSNNTSTPNITNNVFQVGTINLGKAITVAGSPGTSIINNTFNGNGTAIDRDADIMIVNNIFSNNTTAIIDSSGTGSAGNTTYNAFFSNGTDGPTGSNSVTGNPLFVDPAKYDLHLMENSPCIDATDPLVGLLDGIDSSLADIGAYGGPNADPIPFPVQGLAVVSTSGTAINLVWQPNNSYLVTNSTNSGGYTLHYGYAPGTYDGTTADSGTSPSPISVGPYTTFSLRDLITPAPLVPAAPVVIRLVPGNTQLGVEWSPVAGATGYYVHYGDSSPGQHKIDVGNATSHVINGLTNGQPYRVTVSAYVAATYYLAVTAFDNTLLINESALVTEVTTQLSNPWEGPVTDMLIDYPDASFPLLPNKGGGCFIATAAYGSDSAPEVQVLRTFRDRWLLTNGPGRALVQLYYRYSPQAAATLNAHPAFKPAVRTALLPVVRTSAFLTGAPPELKAMVLMLIGCVALFTLFVLLRKGYRGGVR